MFGGGARTVSWQSSAGTPKSKSKCSSGGAKSMHLKGTKPEVIGAI